MQLGDDSLIGHVIRRLRLVTDELLLITNNPTEYVHLDVLMRGDIISETGALGGIYTGLTYASHDAVLCVACDSPFLETNLLTYLVSVLGEYDAVMPYTDSRRPSGRDLQSYVEGVCNPDSIKLTSLSNKEIGVRNPYYPGAVQIILQTLCAAYSKRCLPIITLMLRESELRVHALQERARVRCISPEVWQAFDPEGMSFFNINTPEDFEKAKKLTLLKRSDIING